MLFGLVRDSDFTVFLSKRPAIMAGFQPLEEEQSEHLKFPRNRLFDSRHSFASPFHAPHLATTFLFHHQQSRQSINLFLIIFLNVFFRIFQKISAKLWKLFF